MQFWRYDVEEVLCYMTDVWWRPTSRPVLMVVGIVTVGVLLMQRVVAA
jgi:hypothetical protein